jgi:hypothetical protein
MNLQKQKKKLTPKVLSNTQNSHNTDQEIVNFLQSKWESDIG